MKFRQVLFIAGLVALLSSCTDDTTTNPETLGAPTNVGVSVIDSATVYVHWVRAANDRAVDTVTVYSGGAVIGRTAVTYPDTSVYVRGLLPTINYNIVVSSRDMASSGVSVMIPLQTKVVTGLRAVSLSSTSIGLRWTRDANDASDDTVNVRNSAGVVISKLVTASPGASAVMTGLTVGTTYTMTVHNAGGASAPISWMTANRLGPVNVYEFNSSSPCGLNLQTGNAISLSNNPNGTGVDFWLDENPQSSSGLMLNGGQLYDATWRHGYINNDQVFAFSLDQAYSSTDFSTFMNAVAAGPSGVGNQFAIASSASTSGSRILTVETDDGNLARIEIVPQSSGLLYGGSGSDRYITVNISYNPSANKPYAGRPFVRHRGWEPRVTVR